MGRLNRQKNQAMLLRAFADFRVNCEIAREIGAEKMVLHLWNGKPSDTRIENHLAA